MHAANWRAYHASRLSRTSVIHPDVLALCVLLKMPLVSRCRMLCSGPAVFQLMTCAMHPSLQLLDNSLMKARISTFHNVMSIALPGILPRGYPLGGPHRQCTAALSFICIFLGWLLPTALLLRSRYQEATSRLRQLAARYGSPPASSTTAAISNSTRGAMSTPRAQELQARAFGTASADPKPPAVQGLVGSGQQTQADPSAGASSSSCPSGSTRTLTDQGGAGPSISHSGDGAVRDTRRAGNVRTRASRDASLLRLLPAQDRLVLCAINFVFPEWAPPEWPVNVWIVLTVACWLIATLIA